jgi:5-(carboxyamino)imidazole ribonucleotide synthase
MSAERAEHAVRRIGILGGGQLGRMAIEESRKYLAHIEVLTPDYPSPASELADVVHVGKLDDYESVLEFAQDVDVVSYEIEGVSVEALRELERRGKIVIPSAGVLAGIRDKYAQKELLVAAEIPTARAVLVRADKGEDVADAASSLGGFPVVQKARSGGYDGRGVAVLDGAASGKMIRAPSFVEEFVDFERELAVVVARAPGGATVAYPCVEMVFDERANMCDSVLAPARISDAQREEAERISLAAVEAICRAAESSGSPAAGSAGVFAVELFLARSGDVLVNEIAPRPHNSGHFSIEACETSQFDQYVRLLLGLPLGSARLQSPAMMVNIFGGPDCGVGEPEYLGLEEALAVPGVSIHLYGKREARPFRKLGHLTALGATPEEAAARAEAARAHIKIRCR